MNAAPQVTLVNFSKSEMELIPGSPTQFAQTVTDYLGADVSVLQPILPYIIVVKNGSVCGVTELTVRWTLTNNQGQSITNTGHFRLKGIPLRPGEMIMMAPLSGLSIPMRGPKPRLQNAAHLALVVADTAQRYGQQTDVTISLDSVFFDDDSMAGPDLEGEFDRVNRENNLKRSVGTEVLKRAPGERDAYLKPVSSSKLGSAEDLQYTTGIFRGIMETLASASSEKIVSARALKMLSTNPRKSRGGIHKVFRTLFVAVTTFPSRHRHEDYMP